MENIADKWEDLLQEETPNLDEMLKFMNKSEFFELFKKMIESDDDGVFFQKESVFPICQYVNLQSFICLLRDSNGDDIDSLLFALPDPLEDYLNIKLDSSIYDIIKPSWICGFHESDYVGNITLLDTENKQVQTFHLVLKESEKPVGDKKYECILNPRLQRMSRYYDNSQRRATILDVPLNSTELSNLSSIGCYSNCFLYDKLK